jgi:low affinity Fe/Cu permease
MSPRGRLQARGRLLQRTALVAGALVVLTLLFAISGHWVLTIITGVAAAVAVWVFLQARAVR